MAMTRPATPRVGYDLLTARACVEWRVARGFRCSSDVEGRLEAAQPLVVPGGAGFAPGVAALLDEVGEVHAAVAAAELEVIHGLSGAVEVEYGLQAVAGPLDGDDAFAFGTRGAGALELGVAF